MWKMRYLELQTSPSQAVQRSSMLASLQKFPQNLSKTFCGKIRVWAFATGRKGVWSAVLTIWRHSSCREVDNRRYLETVYTKAWISRATSDVELSPSQSYDPHHMVDNVSKFDWSRCSSKFEFWGWWADICARGPFLGFYLKLLHKSWDISRTRRATL